ncbi:MAG: hypothetical protein TR69_WS6001000258 [candidate division WS6 bacterium OLB20]|uniref:DUF5667 domain-containing protein n=1 Tax=candidate division WS6 bacterium OLB20 TaxID=1617426 RepID=A0A136M0G0_9BACT|nr:MAG: hypothetical protein TR69_WS6001000258 [candidate division WS6 bacterium OLB20]
MQKIRAYIASINFKTAALVFVPLFIIFVGGYFIDRSADQAEPGSSLYGLDRTFETVRRTLPKGAVGDARFEIEVQEERFIEFKSMYSRNPDDPNLLEAAKELQTQQDRLWTAFDNAKDRYYAPQENEYWLAGRYEGMMNVHMLVFDEIRRDRKDTELADQVRLATQKYRATGNYVSELMQQATSLEGEDNT